MSGRRFRIESDSEDEDAVMEGDRNDIPGQDEEDIERVSQGARKRRARIESDEDEEGSAGEVTNSLNNDDGDIDEPETITRRNYDREDDGTGSGVDKNGGGTPTRAGVSEEMDDHGDDDPQNDEESPMRENEDNQEDQDEEETARKVVKKKVVKNPQPKLDATLLTGNRGLIALKKMQPYIRLKGTRGSEGEDLKCILHNLQLWGHKMFPKMQTKDVYERCYRLGTKMPVKVYLRKMRLGQISDFERPLEDSDEEINRGTEGEEIENRDPEEVERMNHDIFEQLVSDRNSQSLEDQSENRMGQPDNIPDRIQISIEERRRAALQRREELQKQRELQRELEEREIEMEKTMELEACS